MPLWGIKYADADDRWWVDLVCQDRAPEVRYLLIGARAVADGFHTFDGRLLVRKASVWSEDLADWPTDRPTLLAPLGTGEERRHGQ
jgi:hypothetical protein